MIVMTNAGHKSVRKLYKDYFDIYPAYRNSVLAGNPKYRGRVKELVITNLVDW